MPARNSLCAHMLLLLLCVFTAGFFAQGAAGGTGFSVGSLDVEPLSLRAGARFTEAKATVDTEPPASEAYIYVRIVNRPTGQPAGSEYYSNLGLDEGARPRPGDTLPSPEIPPDISSSYPHTFTFSRPAAWDAIDPNSWGTVLDEDLLELGNYRLVVDVKMLADDSIAASKSVDFTVVPGSRPPSVSEANPVVVIGLAAAVLFALWKARESVKAKRGKREIAKAGGSAKRH